MIGIIGAMEEEVAEIKKLMDIQDEIKHLDFVFYKGFMKNKEIILLQGGIGKVNAAIATTLLLSNYDIDYVINIGSAGGLHLDQNVGDVVISSSVVHHDVDVTAFGRKTGEVPGLPQYFNADKRLLDEIHHILDSFDIKSHIGIIASGDQFISTKQQVTNIKNNFPDAICAEMEAASIAQVCYVFHKRFIITRSLSDVFDKGDSGVQFDEYLKKASYTSAKMCYELVTKL